MGEAIRVLPASSCRFCTPGTGSSTRETSGRAARDSSSKPADGAVIPARALTTWCRKSASTRMTRFPLCARETARLKETVVFPSPGMVLVTRTILAVFPVGCARSRRTCSAPMGTASRSPRRGFKIEMPLPAAFLRRFS